MTTLKIYLLEILAVCVPAIIVFLCFKPYRMKALAAMKLKSSRQREIALILFVASIFGILALTLWPSYVWEDSPGMWGHLRILIGRPTWQSNLSLVPFTVFKDYWDDLLKSPVFFFVTLLNFFGNLAIFVPIGLFPALLFRNATWKRSAMIGLGMSSFIEITQYLIMRNTAVDDVILNTAGAMCGYLIYLLIRRRFPGFAAGFLCQEE
jgi:glycopeptide antibiotics resistance protein